MQRRAKTTPLSAYASEGCSVGHGQLELVQIGEPQQLPYIVTSWPPGGLNAVVLHLSKVPSPELVVMLYELRRALGTGLLYLACHSGSSDEAVVSYRVYTRAYEALSLTGHKCRGNTSDHLFSVWSGEEKTERLPHLLAPVLRHGDVSNRTAGALCEILPAPARVMEIWPRLGRFTRRCLRRGDQVTVVVKARAGAKDRLLSFLT